MPGIVIIQSRYEFSTGFLNCDISATRGSLPGFIPEISEPGFLSKALKSLLSVVSGGIIHNDDFNICKSLIQDGLKGGPKPV
jgi:hypothetical protein